MRELSAPQHGSHQTVRLGVGRHDGPGDVVCTMELASMLAGERFSDHPVSVCPIIGGILRAYNDRIDDRRRSDLYRYASECVGTRGGYELQYQRARFVIAWAGEGYGRRGRVGRALHKKPPKPLVDSGPDEIASYMLGSIGRRRSDESHATVLRLIERLIEMGVTDAAVGLEAPAPESDCGLRVDAPRQVGPALTFALR